MSNRRGALRSWSLVSVSPRVLAATAGVGCTGGELATDRAGRHGFHLWHRAECPERAHIHTRALALHTHAGLPARPIASGNTGCPRELALRSITGRPKRRAQAPRARRKRLQKLFQGPNTGELQPSTLSVEGIEPSNASRVFQRPSLAHRTGESPAG